MRLAKKLAGLLALAAFALQGAPVAAEYPDRPIYLVVPYSAGGSSDFVGRILADEVSGHLGQPVAVENKPGASSAVGAEYVARSDHDGYRLLLGTGTLAIDRTLRPNLPYNVHDDFEPISRIVRSPFVITVREDFPTGDLEQFIAYAKEHPGELNYGTPGINTQTHLATELFGNAAGLDWVQIPFKGESKALAAMLGGEIQTALLSLSTARPQIEAGTVRALAVTGPNRSPFLPDVPTITESGLPEAEVTFWFGIFAPKGTPADVIEKLNAAIVASLNSKELAARLQERGFETAAGPAEKFKSELDGDVRKWADVARQAGLKPQG